MKMQKEYLLYRKAITTDLPALIALGVNAYGVYREVLGDEQWAVMQKGLSDEVKIGQLLADSECVVCEYNGLIVGMVYYLSSGHPWEMYPADWAYIRLLGVHPKYAGLGIGRRLMQQCIEMAKQSGEKVLALHTSEMMNYARQLYEAMGFVKTRDLPMRLGMHYWLYELRLV